MSEKPYLLVNSEYDVYYNGEWQKMPYKAMEHLNSAVDWIGSKIRNWEAQRSGGKFSQIEDACWLFVVFQREKDGPVFVRVSTEIGYYRGDQQPGELEGPEIGERLNRLVGTINGIEYEVRHLEDHEAYYLLNMTAEYPEAKESLWAEMLRVTADIAADDKLSDLRNWIL